MGEMKELATALNEISEQMEKLAKDLAEILEYIKEKKKLESTVLRKNRNNRSSWGRLI